MRLKSLFVGVCAFAFLFVVGCSSVDSPVSSSSDGERGRVSVTFKLGNVGSLAKAAAIELDSLVVDFSAAGEVPVRRQFTISGNDQQTVNFEIELAAGKTWSIMGRTYARRGDVMMGYSPEEVHYGTTQITVVEGINPPVSLSIDSRYSMLMVRINPVPDSSTYMGLAQGDDRAMMWGMWDDTTYTKGAKPATDTVKLYYDWLNVQQWGSDIQVIIRGDWNGQSNLDLYWGTVNIPEVIAGQDASYSFNLNWIGPSNITGQLSLSATVGKFAMITVDGTPINP